MYILSFFMLGLQILILVAVIIALIYLIFKRIEDKKKETFEQRDN